MRIVYKSEIEHILNSVNPSEFIEAQEAGFVAYSNGNACIPEVGHLYFEHPPGDCHIKYGYIKGSETFCIKVATGFYENCLSGLSNSHGLMMVFNQVTGVPQAILLDEGILTNVRTAMAGAISAKYLAPTVVNTIGIIGTGIQARLQFEWLSWITGCKQAMVWGRTPERATQFCKELPESLNAVVAFNTREIAQSCELIVCCTASKSPILFAEDMKAGTHLIAMGADGNGKQELDPTIFDKADICSVDSLNQCLAFGDSSFSSRKPEDFIELGKLIQSPSLRRQSNTQMTISDLTGVAVQDIQIAQSILKHLR